MGLLCFLVKNNQNSNNYVTMIEYLSFSAEKKPTDAYTDPMKSRFEASVLRFTVFLCELDKQKQPKNIHHHFFFFNKMLIENENVPFPYSNSNNTQIPLF